MKIEENFFTINSRKFDKTLHRSWSAELTKTNGALMVFKGVFDEEVKHADLGVIKRGTVSYEYFWTDRWYNVFRFHEPDGELRNYYCNISHPPVIAGHVLDFVDLDIDVLVWKDYSVEILDVEEFKENSKKFDYPPQLIKKVDATLKQLLIYIEDKNFPFVF